MWACTCQVLAVWALVVCCSAVAMPLFDAATLDVHPSNFTMDQVPTSEFQDMVFNNGNVNRTFVDKLSPEEAKVFITTGQLPNRTQKLIDQLSRIQTNSSIKLTNGGPTTQVPSSPSQDSFVSDRDRRSVPPSSTATTTTLPSTPTLAGSTRSHTQLDRLLSIHTKVAHVASMFGPNLVNRKLNSTA